MTALFANNATTTVATAIDAIATTLVVNDGSAFPTPDNGAGEFFMLTLTDYTAQIYEIVSCTARSGNTLTIVRAQENTSPESFPIGAQAENRPTAAVLNRIDGRELDDLIDVDAGTPLLNDALKWDGTKWVAGPASVVTALDDLTDVFVAGAVAGNALVYNGVNWFPGVNGDVSVSSESTVTPLEIAVVTALPGSPDPNTIYFVV